MISLVLTSYEDFIDFGNPYLCGKRNSKKQVDIDLIDDLSVMGEGEKELLGNKREEDSTDVGSKEEGEGERILRKMGWKDKGVKIVFDYAVSEKMMMRLIEREKLKECKCLKSEH